MEDVAIGEALQDIEDEAREAAFCERRRVETVHDGVVVLDESQGEVPDEDGLGRDEKVLDRIELRFRELRVARLLIEPTQKLEVCPILLLDILVEIIDVGVAVKVFKEPWIGYPILTEGIFNIRRMISEVISCLEEEGEGVS